MLGAALRAIAEGALLRPLDVGRGKAALRAGSAADDRRAHDQRAFFVTRGFFFVTVFLAAGFERAGAAGFGDAGSGVD
jgi:hypothetical protein